MLDRCRSGDELAWRALVERFSRYVYAITRAHRLADAEADDVFQEVFLRTWRNLADLRDPEGLRPWIGQVTRRLCVDQIRRGGRETPEEDAAADLVDPSPDAFARIDLALEVHEAMAALPADCRTILDAFFCRDRSYSEIGEEFSLPAGTIASRISRCLDRLRRRITVPVA